MKSSLSRFAVLGLAMVAAALGRAQIITHTPANAGVPTNPVGVLAPANVVGTALISFGVDYTFGNKEGIFNDPPLAFGGANASNVINLITAVDGRIVALNTTNQGLTDYVSVIAGSASANALLLSVFDISNNLIASVFGTANGLSTMTIDRNGIFDIAYFIVSTPVNDTFGVQSVSIETPIGAGPGGPSAVPEPSTYGLMAAAFLGAAVAYRRRMKR